MNETIVYVLPGPRVPVPETIRAGAEMSRGLFRYGDYPGVYVEMPDTGCNVCNTHERCENMTNEETWFAVYQDGFAIFGTGATEESAIDDAKQWVDEPDDLKSEIESARGFHGDMKLIRISKPLKEDVEKRGGNIPIIKDDDGIYRSEEEMACSMR